MLLNRKRIKPYSRNYNICTYLIKYSNIITVNEKISNKNIFQKHE